MADVLDKPVHQLADAGFANSLGTAMFAFERIGEIDATDVSKRVEVNHVYEPDPATRARYDDLAGIFADAFKRTRPILHRLNKPH